MLWREIGVKDLASEIIAAACMMILVGAQVLPAPGGISDKLWRNDRRVPQLLTHHPLGGCLLALPGLKELLRQTLQGLGINRGIDGPAHALELEFLTEAESEWFRHDVLVLGSLEWTQSYKLFQVAT